jgi:hypothetical protein
MVDIDEVRHLLAGKILVFRKFAGNAVVVDDVEVSDPVLEELQVSLGQGAGGNNGRFSRGQRGGQESKRRRGSEESATNRHGFFLEEREVIHQYRRTSPRDGLQGRVVALFRRRREKNAQRGRRF